MIPEFPLPPVDADFYKSQIHNIPPMFGHFVTVPQLTESTTLFTKVENPIGSNMLKNSVKMATIRQRRNSQIRRLQNQNSSSSTISSISTASKQFASTLLSKGLSKMVLVNQ